MRSSYFCFELSENRIGIRLEGPKSLLFSFFSNYLEIEGKFGSKDHNCYSLLMRGGAINISFETSPMKASIYHARTKRSVE